MEATAQATPNPTAPPAGPAPKNRRPWLIAGGGTAVALVAAAALMQVLRSEEGVAAEAAPSAGKATVAGGPATKPQYLARVGEAVITYDQVAAEAMDRYGAEVLEQLINRTTIELACRKRGVTVTQAEVEQEITKIAQEFGLDRAAWLSMLQAERNITPLQYSRDVIWPMLALKKLAGTDVKITEQDIRKTFERDYGPRVKARMIMMDNDRRLREVWTTANEKAAEIRAEGVNAGLTEEDINGKVGAEFGRLAREHSMEPTSKSLDGAIPPIRRHTGEENVGVENAAFNLKTGEISGMVQLPIAGAPRYVVLFCEGRTEPVVTADKMSLVHDEIVAQLQKEKVQESVAKIFQKLQEETPVHNFLTNTSTGGVQPAAGTKLPGGIRPAGATAAAPANPVRR